MPRPSVRTQVSQPAPRPTGRPSVPVAANTPQRNMNQMPTNPQYQPVTASNPVKNRATPQQYTPAPPEYMDPKPAPVKLPMESLRMMSLPQLNDLRYNEGDKGLNYWNAFGVMKEIEAGIMCALTAAMEANNEFLQRNTQAIIGSHPQQAQGTQILSQPITTPAELQASFEADMANGPPEGVN